MFDIENATDSQKLVLGLFIQHPEILAVIEELLITQLIERFAEDLTLDPTLAAEAELISNTLELGRNHIGGIVGDVKEALQAFAAQQAAAQQAGG